MDALRAFLRVTGLGALAGTWRGRFILVFVAVQLLLPLHYYLARRDPHDERFAWRMFSPTRMVKCRPSLRIDGEMKLLDNEFHEAWVDAVKRGRFSVVEAMGAKLCKRNPKSQVEISLDCDYLGAPPQRWGGYDMCTVPEL